MIKSYNYDDLIETFVDPKLARKAAPKAKTTSTMNPNPLINPGLSPNRGSTVSDLPPNRGSTVSNVPPRRGSTVRNYKDINIEIQSELDNNISKWQTNTFSRKNATGKNDEILFFDKNAKDINDLLNNHYTQSETVFDSKKNLDKIFGEYDKVKKQKKKLKKSDLLNLDKKLLESYKFYIIKKNRLDLFDDDDKFNPEFIRKIKKELGQEKGIVQKKFLKKLLYDSYDNPLGDIQKTIKLNIFNETWRKIMDGKLFIPPKISKRFKTSTEKLQKRYYDIGKPTFFSKNFTRISDTMKYISESIGKFFGLKKDFKKVGGFKLKKIFLGAFFFIGNYDIARMKKRMYSKLYLKQINANNDEYNFQLVKDLISKNRYTEIEPMIKKINDLPGEKINYKNLLVGGTNLKERKFLKDYHKLQIEKYKSNEVIVRNNFSTTKLWYKSTKFNDAENTKAIRQNLRNMERAQWLGTSLGIGTILLLERDDINWGQGSPKFMQKEINENTNKLNDTKTYNLFHEHLVLDSQKKSKENIEKGNWIYLRINRTLDVNDQLSITGFGDIIPILNSTKYFTSEFNKEIKTLTLTSNSFFDLLESIELNISMYKDGKTEDGKTEDGKTENGKTEEDDEKEEEEKENKPELKIQAFFYTEGGWKGGKADNIIDADINQTEAEVINRIDELNVFKTKSSYESNDENEYIKWAEDKNKDTVSVEDFSNSLSPAPSPSPSTLNNEDFKEIHDMSNEEIIEMNQSQNDFLMKIFSEEEIEEILIDLEIQKKDFILKNKDKSNMSKEINKLLSEDYTDIYKMNRNEIFNLFKDDDFELQMIYLMKINPF